MFKAIFVADTRSLYHTVNKKFPDHSLNYLDLVKKLEEEHNLLFTFKFAFGQYEANKGYKFKTLLQETGFKVIFDRQFYDADLVLKAYSNIEHVDAVVLASCWHGHFSLLEHAKQKGKLTYLVGFDLPHFVNYFAKPIEVDSSLLRAKNEFATSAK